MDGSEQCPRKRTCPSAPIHPNNLLFGVLHKRSLGHTESYPIYCISEHVFTRTCQFSTLCLLDPDYFMYLWDNL